jgi:hypothetical protein
MGGWWMLNVCPTFTHHGIHKQLALKELIKASFMINFTPKMFKSLVKFKEIY